MKNYNFLFIFFGLYFLITFLTISCKDEIYLPSDEDIPDSNVSYNKHIQPIFNVRCATVGCHDMETKSGGLSLVSYHTTTASYLIVMPGNPDASRLVLAIEGKLPTPMPPPGRPPLTLKQIKAIRTWVAEGAKNN